MKKAALLVIFLVIAAFLLPGCTQGESQYVSPAISGAQAGTSTTASILKEWRILSIVFVLLSVGLISLAYPIANAFNIPELKAWADIELSEAFSTVLIVIVVVAVLVFVELATQGILMGSHDFTCKAGTYCPVSVAQQYIQDYLDKSLAVFDDLMKSSVMAGKLATMSVVFGTNYLWLLYASFSMKVAPEYMIDVTTFTQQMQFLMGMRDALVYQQFLLNEVSNVLAPAALLLGIIFRSFFVTRKLGGLLMAFGIGFLLVFPASYALAFYTLQTTLYGSSTTGGDVSNQFCTISCRQLPPLAYNLTSGATYTRTNITTLFPQGEHESDDDYKTRIDEFIAGEHCETHEELLWRNNESGEECDKGEDGCANTENKTIEDCTPVDTAWGAIQSCGIINYRECPLMCRSLPYPNANPQCSARATEYACREDVPDQCFITRYADMNDPALGGMYDQDSGANDACPAQCRPMVGLKKSGCDIGYGFDYSGGGMLVQNITDQMTDSGYLGNGGQGVMSRCDEKDKTPPSFSKLIASKFCEPDDNATKALSWLGFEDLKEGGTVSWDEACPNNCRWVTTTGTTGDGCRPYCTSTPSNPFALWTIARNAGTVQGQMAAAKLSCYTIIPDIALNDPICTPCSFLIDPGFASYPPVHQRCDNLCGKAKMVGVSSEGDANAVEGFDGPGATKEITKLVVPAIVLPLLNLVITFMFIRTLSPILGGDVDIPGMTGLIK